MTVHIQLLTPSVEFQHAMKDLIETIWPSPYAHDAYVATAVDAYQKPTGEVYAIQYTNVAVRTIGITGFFAVENDSVYLRWTGIVPEFRRKGIFSEVIHLLCLTLKGTNPALCKLIELVPDNEYGQSIVGAFEAVGFVRDTNIAVPEGEDADWKCIPYVLKF